MLDGTDTGFVILENETMTSPGGAYGIAEARIYSGRDLRHYRAATDSSASGETTVCGITVMKKQVVGISPIKDMLSTRSIYGERCRRITLIGSSAALMSAAWQCHAAFISMYAI